MSLRHMGRDLARERRRDYLKTHRPHERYVLKGALVLGSAVGLAVGAAHATPTVTRVVTAVGFIAGGFIAFVLIQLDRHHTVVLLRRGETVKALWRRRYRIITERIPGVWTLRYQSSVGEDYPLARRGRFEFWMLCALTLALGLVLFVLTK